MVALPAFQFHPGEKGRALCETCGLVSTTFDYRDVPFQDGSGTVQDILVAVCDTCGMVVAIPPQSTPAIAAARPTATIPLEASLPAPYLEILDLCAHRIDPALGTGFRKALVLHALDGAAHDPDVADALPDALARIRAALGDAESAGPRRRLSLKITTRTARDLDAVMETTGLAKTDVIKALIGRLHAEIIAPETPVDLKTLRALAAVAA